MYHIFKYIVAHDTFMFIFLLKLKSQNANKLRVALPDQLEI